MTELFLDNKRVVLYDRTAFKFTIENVYFTKMQLKLMKQD